MCSLCVCMHPSACGNVGLSCLHCMGHVAEVEVALVLVAQARADQEAVRADQEAVTSMTRHKSLQHRTRAIPVQQILVRNRKRAHPLPVTPLALQANQRLPLRPTLTQVIEAVRLIQYVLYSDLKSHGELEHHGDFLF